MNGLLILSSLAQPVQCATPFFYENQVQASRLEKTWPKSPKAGPSEGDTLSLWVMDLSVMPPDWKQLNFVCMRVTQNAYIMVETASLDSGYMTAGTVDSIEAAWEDTSLGIWPDTGIFVIDTTAFGPPPDELDNDPRIYLLYYDIEGFMGFVFDGYFNFADEYPDSVAWQQWGMHSNERECLYLNCSYDPPGQKRMLGVLAHEFQHMLHWRGDDDEVPWVNEGLSELAMFLYGAPDNIVEFNGHPDNSLVSWSTGFSDYIKTYLWSLYLYEQFDSSFALTRAIVSEKANTVFGVDNALSSVGAPCDITEAFQRWVLANYLDDTTIAGGIYGYYGEDLPPFVCVAYHSSYPVGPKTSTVKLWAVDYLKFRNAQDGLQFTFDGQGNGQFFLAAMLFDSSGPTQVVDFSPANPEQDTTVYFPGVGSQYYQAIIAIAAYPDPINGDSSAETYTYWADGTDIKEKAEQGSLAFQASGSAISLNLPEKTRISLSLFDASGRLVQTLYQGVLPAGGHSFFPKAEVKGVYFAVLRYPGGTKTLKITE